MRIPRALRTGLLGLLSGSARGRRRGARAHAAATAVTGACAAGLLLGACALAGPAVPGGRDRCPPTRGQEMVDLINDLRVREGLPPLRVDRRLVAAAQAHAEDMAAHGFVGHDGSDGSLPAFRVDRTRYPWILILENTAGGHPTASGTFAAWQASETHRRNHLDPGVRHVGIGYAENGATPLRTYWVAVFGAAAEAPLTPPGGCHP